MCKWHLIRHGWRSVTQVNEEEKSRSSQEVLKEKQGSNRSVIVTTPKGSVFIDRYKERQDSDYGGLSTSAKRVSIDRYTSTIPEDNPVKNPEWGGSLPLKRASTDGLLDKMQTRSGLLTNSEWSEITKLLHIIECNERSSEVQTNVKQIRRLIPRRKAGSSNLRRSIFAQPSIHTEPRMSEKSLLQMNGIHDIFNGTFFPSSYRDASDSNVLVSSVTEIASSKYVLDKYGIRHRPKRSGTNEVTKLEKLKAQLSLERVGVVFRKEDWGQWGWHAFELWGVCEEPMGLTALKVFSESARYGSEAIDVRLEELASFFCLLGLNYKTNPFHNELHAVDIFITTKYFLDNIETLEELAPKDCFALLVAAACQGVCHPGVTNAYLINSGDELAITYNDQSILENWHLAQAFRILKCFPRFFENWNVPEKQQFRKIMVSCILGTDFLTHSGYQVFVKEKYNPMTNDGRLGILPCLVHSAGLSMIAKPTLKMKEMIDRIFEEYFNQGELEKKNHLPISPLCDKNKINIPETQIGFIQYLALHWFELMMEKVSQKAFSEAVKHIHDNERFWDRKLLEKHAVDSVYSLIEEAEDNV